MEHQFYGALKISSYFGDKRQKGLCFIAKTLDGSFGVEGHNRVNCGI